MACRLPLPMEFASVIRASFENETRGLAAESTSSSLRPSPILTCPGGGV